MIEPVLSGRSLEQIYYSIFRSTDPFGDAGQSTFPIKAVIYPTYGYHLTERQFKALKEANDITGGKEFFISQVEHEPANPFVVGEHWKCVNPSFSDYNEISIALENAIYSVDGSWGALVSHEDHALIVSKMDFWKAFKDIYTDWREDYILFLNNWKQSKEDSSWQDNFLKSLTIRPKT